MRRAFRGITSQGSAAELPSLDRLQVHTGKRLTLLGWLEQRRLYLDLKGNVSH